MSSAKITLLGLYQWDNDLFKDMILPDGIDKDLLIQSLMLKGGEFEVLYADPAFMRRGIAVWSSKWFRTFSEWLRGTQASWNPIHNYDRFEDIKDDNTKNYSSKTTADYSDNRTANLHDKRTADLKDTRTANLTDTRTADLTDLRALNLIDTDQFNNADTTEQTKDGKAIHEVSAYDANGYVGSSRDTTNNGTTRTEHSGSVSTSHAGNDATKHSGTDTNRQTGTDTTATTGTDTTAHTGTDNLRRTGTLSDTGGNEKDTNLHTAHIYGNIGVTQSSDMLRSFYDISAWNLYDHISDVFIGEMLIPVY